MSGHQLALSCCLPHSQLRLEGKTVHEVTLLAAVFVTLDAPSFSHFGFCACASSNMDLAPPVHDDGHLSVRMSQVPLVWGQYRSEASHGLVVHGKAQESYLRGVAPDFRLGSACLSMLRIAQETHYSNIWIHVNCIK